MSRKSHAFAEGQPAFSVRVEKILESSGDVRYKATCRNKPAIFALADSEQKAILALRSNLEKAVDSDDLGMKGPGQL